MTGFRQNRVRRDQERRAVAATQRRLVGVGRHRPSMVAVRLTVAAARTAGAGRPSWLRYWLGDLRLYWSAYRQSGTAGARRRCAAHSAMAVPSGG